MVQYVKTVKIHYGFQWAPGTVDINGKMGGEYVYIIPEFTSNRAEAASLFSFTKTHTKDFCAGDISKGDGKEWFRYIVAYYTFGAHAAITSVWISKNRDTTEGDGRTEDFNKGRGGDFLYLCWEYEKNTSHSLSIPLFTMFPGWVVLHHLLKNKAVTADHPYYTVDESRDNLPENQLFNVRLGNLVFSQDSVAPIFSNNTSEEVVKMINELLDIPNLEDRRRVIEARFKELNVVPIRRHSGDQFTDQLVLSLDNRRLVVMRSVLPEDSMIAVRVAPRGEREKIKWRWTSNDEGFWIKVRSAHRPPPKHDEL
ncbi:hypothetical protein CONPUDRAFT_75504 [Coniophora puteana RWD-64-598 SS2]|uniref:Uncharacterized protein n=1 Tax=Coniophora puteana (strain RWD-64-598) TaxID=741705 RepID=A0A5M3MFB2_CONPW|nr:uncharacterized protein CONPUDRAFT_75504 [Coniophora puteana RWD-64-598 SS2]EIW77686.1 hypothetical protein CONPUDRAFT_75504 [Coniophora puteana RWD-64-598 SS2]